MNTALKDNPLLLPTIVWLLGLMLAEYVTIPFLFCCGCFGFILLMIVCTRFKFISLLLLIVVLALLRSQSFSQIDASNIFFILDSHEKIKQPIDGKIVSEVIETDGLFSFILEVKAINEIPVSGRIKFYTRTKKMRYGDLITTVAEIKSINPSTNPDGFNYRDFLQVQKIYGSGFSITPISVIGSKPGVIKKIIFTIRKKITQKIESRFQNNKAFVKAIVLGDKKELGDYRENMTKAGLSHLLAVSGLHVGIITLMILLMLSILIPSRIIVRIIAIIFLLFYAALCQWSPSVTRSGIMISFYLLGKILNRKISTTNILALSAVIITAINPRQLFSVGFQLSYLAVYTLLNILPLYWKKVLLLFRAKNIGRLPRLLLQTLITTIVLSIYLGPVTTYYFHQFNLNGIAGNLAGIPLLGIILPLAILIILLPVNGFILTAYQNSFIVIMKFFNLWVDKISELPFHFTFLSLEIWQVILLYLILFFLPLPNIRNKAIKIGLILAIPLILLFSLTSLKSNKLICTFFDCGLGDMALLQLPDNETIMVDCGPPSTSSGSFSKSTLPYMQKNGLKNIDFLVITHAHNDHYGGIKEVISACNVKRLMVTDEFQNRSIWLEISSMIIEEGAEIITISDTCHFDFGDLTIKVLHPDRDYSDDNINNASIVLKLDYHDFSLLLNGDLEVEGEEYLLAKYSDFLPSDITKVGHHGSKTSSSDKYLKKVNPKLAFIPAPIKNRFGFPHQSTVEKYSFLENHLIIAGKDGALTIETDGTIAQFTSWRSRIYSDLQIK